MSNTTKDAPITLWTWLQLIYFLTIHPILFLAAVGFVIWCLLRPFIH